MNHPRSKTKSKITELSRCHGQIFDEMLESGRLPGRQVDDFFGRHEERQRMILLSMGEGTSYSAARKESQKSFDTKRWSKIPARSASCRGLVLKAVCGYVQNLDELQAVDSEEILLLADRIEAATREQIQRLAMIKTFDACEFGEPRKAKSVLDWKGQTANKAMTDLRTAKSKLEKNARDLPRMLDKLQMNPSIRDVAVTSIESSRILNGIKLLKRMAEMGVDECPPRTRDLDPWGIGVAYASHLQCLTHDQATSVRIATHRKPDADALVSSWIVDRFLLAAKQCQVEFVAYDFRPDAASGFDAVLDVGQRHDPSNLIFDHKPPAFQHRDEHCASSLAWKHVLSLGCPVPPLEQLVRVVHDGDAVTRRMKSTDY